MSDGIGTSWGPRGAWDDIIIERSFGAHVSMPGVIVHPLSPAGMATLMLKSSSNTRSKAGSRTTSGFAGDRNCNKRIKF